ncbi:MAG: hypothetical protein GY803_23260 [Chloroflexi bacterium]|nr:hypothetical protein [Chloroflexota bacterium]
MIDFNKRMTKSNLSYFAEYILELQRRIGFKVSARGWCYQLESERIINKDQFNKVEGWINRCRRIGLLPIDFTAEEASRQFSGVEIPEESSPVQYFASWLKASLKCGEYYNVDWWAGEDYYIQIIVEKIDLKTLFSPICEKYHIPIATSKGWSSMTQRAEYARRFKEAEDLGLQPVLLYCGDHDPDGLRISDFIRSNLLDLKDIEWADGVGGYDPCDLEINRFGLNRDFIEHHQLTWIDNLITGSGKNLASPFHKNHRQPYVQNYLAEIGERKCEANAIVPMPQIARDYVEDVVLSYLGGNVLDRFAAKREAVENEILEHQKETGVGDVIRNAINGNL